MREIHVDTVTQVVSEMSIDANLHLNPDVYGALEDGFQQEEGLSKEVLGILLENAQIAKDDQMPMCQDTGMTVVFMDIGQDVHFVGGDLEEAINAGVRDGYQRGYLRKSVVRDPIYRANTGDNTPAIVHYQIVPGEQVKITIAPKGFGSENMSRMVMLSPAAGIEGVKDFIVETVRIAGPNPCPPVVVGVGVGGTVEKAALLAKKALLRDLNDTNPDPMWAAVEEELYHRINQLGIGPAGFGGKTTALGVKILPFPTHIAGLPLAVNINCHAARHTERVI